MKKVILSLFAVAALASCVQTEELGVANNKEAIGFDTFVDNATKGDLYTTANLEAFKVYGTISQNGAVVTNIFDGVEVSKDTGVWAYDPQYTQYWVAGFHYDFAAVVDGTVVKNSYNMPESIEVDMTEQEDVLYATAAREFNGGQTSKVNFTFDHLLSKAKFTVKNTIVNGKDFVYNIESIKIKNADKNGAYDVATGVWAANDTYCADFGVDADLAMGSQPVSGADVLLLPSNNKNLEIEVEYNLTYNGAILKSETKTLNAVLTLEQGKAYNFIVEFGNPGEEIEFKAEVNDWANGSVEVFQGVSVPVTTAQELIEAIADPEVGEAVLMNDIDLTSTITRSGEESTPVIAKSFVIDGNGKKLNYSGSNRVIDITYNNGENSNLVVTIKNLTINITSSYCQRGINYNAGGLLIIDNVKFEGTAPTYAVNCPAYSDNAVVKIKNSELTGNIALNVWGSDMKIDVIDTYLSNHDTNEAEDYATVMLNNDGSNIADGTVINIKGGKVVAYNQNGELSNAIYNATSTGDINVSESTEVIGNSFVQVAVVAYANTDNVYGMSSIEAAIAKCINTNGLCVRVTRDVVLEEPLTIANGESVVLDLCGHTISATDNATAGYALITNRGTLTINDTVGTGALKVTATNNRGWNAYSSVISNSTNGVLVVNGGTIEHLGGTDMAYGIDILTNSGIGDATCTINGGHIKSTYRAIRQFLNCDKKMNTLVVNGGVIEGANKSIWMQDPSKKSNLGTLTVAAEAQLKGDVYLFVTAGSTEWPVEVSIASAALVGESTVVTGNVPAQYQVVEEDGVWTVIEQLVAATTADLQAALAEGKNVALANDITVETTEMLTAPYGNKMAFSHNGGVFNGNGKAISVKANGDNYVVMTNGGTIKNLDIDRGFRGVVLMYPTQDVYVDNVKVGVNDEVCYTINTAEGDGTHSLYVSNSILNGWCSIGTAVKDVTFTNCTFGQGTYYTDVFGRLVKPYVDTVFEGCDFCNKCYLDLSAFVGTKVIVKNCTVNGVKITAENWASLVAPESTCKDGQISVELKNGSYLTAENVADYIVFE